MKDEGDKTFVRVTNKDIAESIKKIDDKLTVALSTSAEHTDKIKDLYKYVYAISGVLATIAIASVVFLLTGGKT